MQTSINKIRTYIKSIYKKLKVKSNVDFRTSSCAAGDKGAFPQSYPMPYSAFSMAEW